MTTYHLTLVLGTRPEAVKMAPVIAAFKAQKERFKLRVVSTGQHQEMLTPILDSFALKVDHDLQLMRPGLDLPTMTATMLEAMTRELKKHPPQLLLVQGDTTTVFSAALAAFYAQVPIGHVEAGLRTHDLYNPFPEEANRCLVSVLADIHFAPTQGAAALLRAENIPEEKIAITGNTVVDAVQHMADNIGLQDEQLQNFMRGRRMALLTAHRRESWGPGLERICQAVLRILDAYTDLVLVFPVHANPLVRQIAEQILGQHERVLLLPPVGYTEFIALMHQASIILTDSGGVQEEAPSVGVPVLILRSSTERPEAVTSGWAQLVGTDPDRIVAAARKILSADSLVLTKKENPFGDGQAARRIVLATQRFLEGKLPLLPAQESFVASSSQGS